MAVCSFAHCEAALSLQAAYSDCQIGAFENFHQPVEDTLIVLRPGPKVVFQYELRFANRLKSQLLIGHLFLPIKQMPPREKEETRNQAAFGRYPRFFELYDQFLFQCEKPPAHDRGGFLVQQRFRSRLTGYSQRRRVCEGPLLGTFRTLPTSMTVSGRQGKADLNNVSIEVRKCP
jgi:hypothetical protein